MSKFQQFLEKTQEIHDIMKTAQLLGWDREVNMPRAGSAERIQQMATMRKLIHGMSTSDEYGEMIASAKAELNGSDPEGFEKRLIALVERQYDRSRKLPADLVKRTSIISGKANVAWGKARAENNFAHFEPHLAQVVEIGREMAEHYGYEDEKYDGLLAMYELGMTTKMVRAIFDEVKAATVDLLQAIVTRGRAIDDSLLHQPFDVEQQKAFAHYIAKAVGYDFDRGHLGTVVHPFASSFSRNDARITSRWYPDFLNPGLFGTLHESGHAMYEQGTAEAFTRTPLARGASMGMHESQSRSIENIIGRSYGFWQVHYPALQEHFPAQLNNHSLDDFYRAINKVQPSYIRVEADELTYNLHIILRFEIEQALIKGELDAADLPAAWNDKMQSLVGVTPPTDTLGCLQDVHWTRPSFGYFPTYALGNFYGAQFYATIEAQDASIIGDLKAGNPTRYVDWLRENIHTHGSKFTPAELVQKATGQSLQAQPFINYVNNKFTEIYEL